MSARIVWPIVVFVCLATLACDETPAPIEEPARPTLPPIGDRFDPGTTGTISGVVCWQGDLLRVPPFRSIDEPLIDPPARPATDRPNPNAPRIDPDTLALTSAVVFLRRVDPRRSRPWDHPAVRVEMRQQRYQIVQGSTEASIGFVRVGDAVEFLSHEGRSHMVQARGAAFFSIGLPKLERPRSRIFDALGVVELSSGSGYYWMRAYLHICEHPYFARLAEFGRFSLERVPAGEYDLVVWHPSWRVAKSRRNPDIFRMQQVHFGEPIEIVRRVRVKASERAEVNCSVGTPRSE